MKKISLLFLCSVLFLSVAGHVEAASQKAKESDAVVASLQGTVSLSNSDGVFQKLKEGNARFVDGRSIHPNQDAARRALTLKDGQHPFVSVLTCADSRVPPEEIFDAGIGDVFVVRVAGNVAGTDEIGTLEYGAGHLGIPVIVVMGHTKCGAVTAVMKGDKVGGNIAALVSKIVPAAKKVKDAKKGDMSDETIDLAIRENVWQAIGDLFSKSEEIQNMVIEGKLKVVGAIYDITTGKVEWLGEHPKQTQLLGAEGALAVLKEGNERSVAGTFSYPHSSSDRREEVAKRGQSPFVSILTCADSRVPPEEIFDAGFGDVFVVRVAGNVAGTDELGTLEYGVGHLGTPLVVVMGHTKCGAVTAVVKGDHVGGSSAPLVAKIAPAAKKAKAAKPTATQDEMVDAAIRENVWQAIADVFAKSEEMKEMAAKKKVKVVGALYDIGTGKVEWLGEHPKQKELLSAQEGSGLSGVSEGAEGGSAPAHEKSEH
jgi:carbonic anhydrase